MLRTASLALALAALAPPPAAATGTDPAPAPRISPETAEAVRATLREVYAARPAARGARTEADDATAEPVFVQFRDLFDGRGKPSARAVELSGRTVEIAGFMTDGPTESSPFLVLVGAPTTVCPYCTSVSEADHLPYVLVYPEDGQQVGHTRSRIRITGRLEASHENEAFYGLHNDIRIRRAAIASDVSNRRQRAPMPELPAVPAVSEPAARSWPAPSRPDADAIDAMEND